MLGNGEFFKDFTGKYPLSKVLRFELIPQGKTLDYIHERNILGEDEQRAEDYKVVKKLIDQHHREFIERNLGSQEVQLDWQPLCNALKAYREAKDYDTRVAAGVALANEQAAMRSKVAALLTGAEGYKDLWGKTLIEEVLPAEIIGDEDYDYKAECLESFCGFNGYFSGFHENRRNLYSDEAESTAISYRVVNDNFTKFMSDCELFQAACERYPEAVEGAGKSLAGRLGGRSLGDIFKPISYNDFLSQTGITFFNDIVGGWVVEGGEKVKGLNEWLNEAHQGSDGTDRRIRLEPLYKQLLSEVKSSSFYFDEFADDRQMADAIVSFADSLLNAVNPETGEVASVFSFVANVLGFQDVEDYDWSRIYVEEKRLPALSKEIFGSWSVIGECLERCRCELFGPTGGMSKKEAAKWAVGRISLEELDAALDACGEHVEWGRLAAAASELAQKVSHAQDGLIACLANVTAQTRLQGDEEALAVVKGYLDAVQDFYHFVLVFDACSELERDPAFYADLDVCLRCLDSIVPLYNKVRNRLSKKAYDQRKYKLNFRCATLAGGWDVNKERDNLSMIFRRDGRYYLGIMDAGCKVKKGTFADVPDAEDAYEKMVYKLIPNPHMMIPKVAFSRKGLELYEPSDYILDGYKAGKHKKGKEFDLGFCHDLIDFFKDVIAKNPEWGVFGFEFTPTEEYADISAFYAEVANQGYSLTFSCVPADVVDDLVESGQLYLFQVYSKDWAEGAHGSKNLHTLYFESLFAPENLADVRIKLSGGAELFYRPASIDKPYSHQVGEKMVNKWMKMPNGVRVPLPDDVYMEIFNHVNGKGKGKLSEQAQGYLDTGLVTVKDVAHEVVKDRRYAGDKFMFHVPVAINFKSQGRAWINGEVLEYLQGNPDVNVIGIDRGENNLIYATVVNQRGQIIEQRSLNVINGYDYQAKLEERERQRDEQRRSWKSISGIKQLKEGYLSQAVREVVALMIEHDAIVVLEDLNCGFKRARTKIEKQVYQKFEKQLIDKLNYCVLSKDMADATQPGGVLRGYQLANKFESFQMLGKQSGFLFYLPAHYTEQIDPTTGFACLFTSRQLSYRNERDAKEFFSRFDDIRYDLADGMFKFSFKYSSFDLRQADYRDEWTVCANAAKRVIFTKRKSRWVPDEIDVNDRLKDLFADAGADFRNGEELKDAIAGFTPAQCRELLTCFAALVRLRHKLDGTNHIVSPVMGEGGRFYDTSANDGTMLPGEADANSAYCIALKGLMMLAGQIVPGKKGLRVDLGANQVYDWLEYVQTRKFEA